MPTKSNITIEGARLVFRNFTGKEGPYNPAGARSTGVLINEDMVDTLRADGWNIKWLKPKNEGDEEQAFLPVGVSYSNYPPMINLISSSGKNILDEQDVKILDWADIIHVDIIIRPYNWEVGGKSGIKAYVKTMYVTIADDPFEAKYSNVSSREDDPPFDVD